MTHETLDKMLADAASHRPETGFNVVGFDEFEEPGEQLFLMKHLATIEEARAWKAKNGGYAIYGPNGVED
jgi:hypothetical protein